MLEQPDSPTLQSQSEHPVLGAEFNNQLDTFKSPENRDKAIDSLDIGQARSAVGRYFPTNPIESLTFEQTITAGIVAEGNDIDQARKLRLDSEFVMSSRDESNPTEINGLNVKSVFVKAVKLLVSNGESLPVFKLSKKRPLEELTERKLIQLESEIGAKLFGPVAPGNRREFFNENPKNWIWYEEWTGPDRKKHSTTTRYEIHAEGILKVREGDPYHFIEGKELQNLSTAVQMYHDRVIDIIYKKSDQSDYTLAA